MLSKKLKELISKGKLSEAFDEMNTVANSQSKDFQQTLLLLRSQYSSNEKQNLNGLISSSDYNRNNNRITHSLLSLIDSEFDDTKIPSSTKTIYYQEQPMTPTIQPTQPNKPLSIFISYSKKDNELKEELITHLSSLKRRNKMATWDDRHIIGGELWDDTIKTKLYQADIILFLVSANFIATDYIWDYEIPIAEEQRQNGKVRVIPIILKSCQWTKLDFAKQQALPSKGVPINSFQDRDAAWLEVVEGIEKVINNLS